MSEYIIFGATFAFAAAVQPGPLLAYLVSQTISKGWEKTLPASLAPIISDGPIIILVLLLLNNIPDWSIKLLHLGGGLFLFYLSFNAYKSWKNFNDGQLSGTNSRQTLLSATFVNLLNPAPYLGWSLVMGPLFLKGYRETPMNGFSLIISFYSTMIICLAGIILLTSLTKSAGTKINRAVIGFSAAALLCFGIYQFFLGIC